MRIGLGSAQLGMAYGATNQRGQVDMDEVHDMMSFCAQRGIDLIDTAAIYGEAEELLGRLFPGSANVRLVSKIPELEKPEQIQQDFANALNASLAKLQTNHIYGLLLHDAANLTGPEGGEVWDLLTAAKEEGKAQKIGVSVYRPDEVEAVLARYDIDLIQVPVSLADQRLVQSGLLGALKAAGVEVHARSVFLQGLLLATPETLPQRLSGFTPTLEPLYAMMAEDGLSPLEACLGFIAGQSDVDMAIVGVSCKAELTAIVDTFCRMEDMPLKMDLQRYAIDDTAFLNPAKWPS